jgi:hypothetical protein
VSLVKTWHLARVNFSEIFPWDAPSQSRRVAHGSWLSQFPRPVRTNGERRESERQKGRSKFECLLVPLFLGCGGTVPGTCYMNESCHWERSIVLTGGKLTPHRVPRSVYDHPGPRSTAQQYRMVVTGFSPLGHASYRNWSDKTKRQRSSLAT